jgi:hypothetical protein
VKKEMKFRKPRATTLALIATCSMALTYFSCGDGEEFNVLGLVAEPIAMEGDKAALEEEARVRMDNGDYDGASEILDQMVDDDELDSNQVRLLYASAALGVAGLDIWSIITSFLDGSSSDSTGVDSFFDSFTDTFLGSGDTRTSKIAALTDALGKLQGAPYPNDDRLEKTGCILAGILAVPTIAEAEAAIADVLTALESISASASSGGETCPDIDLLTSATTSVATAAENFAVILTAAENCPYLDLSEASSSMNSIQTSLASLTTTADLGCSDLPTCPDSVPDCSDYFPTCVQEAMDIGEDNTAVSGDGELASCEIILHCTDVTACFGS